jgi:sugar phosphate isomerase/epimerase
MQNNHFWHIGVCSWSLGNDPAMLSRLRADTGISTVHLHVRPELVKENIIFIETLLNDGWHISAGMVTFDQEDYSTLKTIRQTGGIVPDEFWDVNKVKVFEVIDLLDDLSVSYLSFHFGFLDLDNPKLLNRVRLLTDYAGSKGLMLLMETGQETAEELTEFLHITDHPALGINFDPANMILYGKGDPIKSLDRLQKWVWHIHLKDAVPSNHKGIWGIEVPWGCGKVDAGRFLKQLEQIQYAGALCVERERGDNQYNDIKSAVSNVQDFVNR